MSEISVIVAVHLLKLFFQRKYEDELIEARAAGFVKRSARKRQTPLERGWTSASPQGRKFGPPDTESISGGMAISSLSRIH